RADERGGCGGVVVVNGGDVGLGGRLRAGGVRSAGDHDDERDRGAGDDQAAGGDDGDGALGPSARWARWLAGRRGVGVALGGVVRLCGVWLPSGVWLAGVWLLARVLLSGVRRSLVLAGIRLPRVRRAGVGLLTRISGIPGLAWVRRLRTGLLRVVVL